MLPGILSFVDLETTGTSAVFGRIIEIGILRIENNKVVRKYNSLVNPGTSIDPFIINFTGISQSELENAPTFESVKDEVLDILEDSVFVAHNVRFDYSFLKNEFKRLGLSFSPKHFCTVKLARSLYPSLGRYNLDTIVEKFKINCRHRHRALDDAEAIWKFYQKSRKTIPGNIFEKAVSLALKRPTVPVGISTAVLDALPDMPGVYIFYGENGTPLYIGKSVNIRDRVLSHFSSDHLSAKEMKISREVKNIECIKTAGGLSALLLESVLVKKYQPLYNRQLRNARKLIAVKKTVTRDGYNSISTFTLEDADIDNLNEIIGVFRSEKQLKDCLSGLAKEYTLCNKLLGLEKSAKYCFGYHLGQCRGACMGRENYLKYNLRFDEAFYRLKIRSWPFPGPVLITENGGENPETILADKWCCLGKADESLKKPADYTFDYDTYKILLIYILDPKNQKNIKNLKNNNYKL